MHRPLIVLLLVAALSACGSSPDGPVSTDSTAAPAPATVTSVATDTSTSTAPAGEADPPTTTGATDDGHEASSTTTTPPPPSAGTDGHPVVLVAGDGVTSVAADGTTLRLIDGPVITAIDDRAGGVLFQQTNGYWPFEGQTIVWWIPAGTDQPQELLVPSGDQTLELHTVAMYDGMPSILYTREERGDVEDTRQTLRRYDTATGEVTELAVTGGWESGTYEFSTGGDMIIGNWSGEGWHGAGLWHLDGSIVDEPVGYFEGEFDCQTCPRHATLSPDGAAVFFSQTVFADGEVDHETIGTFDLANPSIVTTYALPNQIWVHSIDVVDGYVLVNQWNGDGLAVGIPHVLDLSDGAVIEVPVVGVGAFARAGVHIDGPVQVAAP